MQKGRLVEDLIPVILESADWWQRDLAALSLVSWTWMESALKRLYNSPFLSTPDSCIKFWRTVGRRQALGNLRLASFVHGLNLRPVQHNILTTADQRAYKMAISSILRLRGIERLVIGGDLAVEAERYINLIGFPEFLLDLTIDGSERSISDVCGRIHASLEWDDSMAFRFCGLRSLSLSNVTLDIRSHSLVIEGSEIVYLALHNVHITSGYLVSALSDSPLLHLSVTTSDAVDFDPHVRMVLDRSLTLETLVYEVQGSALSHLTLFDENSAKFPSLKSLSLNGVLVDYPLLFALSRCCRGLESLAVSGRMTRVTAEEWIDLLGARYWSELRKLELPRGTNGPPFEKWSEEVETNIAKVCIRQGICLL